MASTNPFDLLGDNDNDDPSQLIIAAQQQQPKAAPKKAVAPAQAGSQPAQGKLPSKPLPPAQAGWGFVPLSLFPWIWFSFDVLDDELVICFDF